MATNVEIPARCGVPETSRSAATLPDNRTNSRRREAPAGIGIVIHFGDIDLGSTAGLVQRPAHDQRAPGVALYQQDHLTVLEQRRKRSRYHRLRVAARHNDDDTGAIDGSSEIARCALNRSKAASLALDFHSATRSNFGEPRIVDIVEPQLEPGDAQFGDEIETTDSRSDYRNRLRASLRHGFLLYVGLELLLLTTEISR